MTKDRFYLNTPYSEKELVKQLEAPWDPEAKKWYVPEYKDRNLFKRWWPKNAFKPSLKVIK